ncbi:MliC family protein [Frigidibacter sp. MR17.14]|uniref:MliC family protein n=1 Tax=Frigidibacter sp. MR17.14 TaxID=3126509 RepID=UPI0030130A6D
MRRIVCLALMALAAAPVPRPVLAQTGPSFDCAKAESAAEKAVCADPALAAMDRELARVYALAAAKGDDSSLKAMQRGWIKGRDDCWKADDGVPACTRREYALRIEEIRRGSAAARASEGASLGPFPYVCDGFEPVVSAAFVNAGEPVVVLRWLDQAAVLPRAESGSGARYQGPTWAGPAEFWTKGTAEGDEATFLPPGARAGVACRRDATG